MLTIKRTSQFKKDFKRVIKQGRNIDDLNLVINKLANEEILDDKFFTSKIRVNLRFFSIAERFSVADALSKENFYPIIA